MAGFSLLAALVAALPGQAAGELSENAIRESVVKVFATMRAPDPLRPWTKQSPQEVSGSGVVIENKRILTNAHVALYASQIFVQSYQSSDKIAATVEAIGPGIDLAVLRLEDESFFDKRPPLPRATQLPEVKDTVLVYGYPRGGTSMSVTRGIVSRIDFANYNYQTSGIRIQVDAAINPGNSGGPAVVNNRMIGLIFSRLREADNIGYIIPNEEIEIFLKDVADGKYDGKPALYDRFQTLENDALRAKLGMDRRTTGVLFRESASKESQYPLKEWDVLTRIGSHDIDNTGQVRIKDNLRLSFLYVVQKEAKDQVISLRVLREQKPLELKVPVTTHYDLLIPFLQGKYPSYFVLGPLCFSPVTADFIGGLDSLGNRWLIPFSFRGSPLLTRRGDQPAFAGEQLVMVSSRMLPHRISKGYGDPFGQVVKEVNGVAIKNLPHLMETIRDSKDKYLIIRFAERGAETVVFDRRELLAATEEILSDNGIREQYSSDLARFWEKK